MRVFISRTAPATCLVAAVLFGAAPAAQAVFTETFSYPDGPLAGQGPWVVTERTGGGAGTTIPSTGNGQLEVVNGTLRMAHEEPTNTEYWALASFAPVDPDPDGLITVSVQAELGSGDGGNIWWFNIRNAAGQTLAAWDGQWAVARPRIDGGDPVVLGGQALTGNGFDTLTTVLNTNTNRAIYYFNGNLVGEIVPAINLAGQSVGQIQFQRQRRVEDEFDGRMRWDNISVVPEPAAIAFLALGSLAFLRRRRA